MDRLGDMLNNYIGDSRVKATLNEARALGTWNEVVGDAIRANSTPVRIKTGVLYVRTKNASWSQELKGLEPTIIQQINKAMNKEIVKEIRFIHGSGRKQAEDEIYGPTLTTPDIRRVSLTDDEKVVVDALAESIDDGDLKSSFLKLLEKDKKLRRWRKEKDNAPSKR